MPEQDPHELSQALERETDELARDSREVQGQIDEARQDWQRKRSDDAVPGALPPDVEESPEGAQAEPPPEARREG